MSRYVKYAVLAVSIFTFGAFYTPQLIGETDSAGVAKDNSQNLSDVVLSADPAVTITENEDIDLAKALNLSITGTELEDSSGLLSKVEVLTDLDVTVPGTYDVTFSLVDQSLKLDKAVSSVVTVVAVDPTISLATTDVSVPVGTDVDYLATFGPTATEFSNGDLADSITVTTDADLSVAGTYPVTFSATDSDGNVATANATVRTKAPVQQLSLNVAKPNVSIKEESAFSDANLISLAGITAKYGNTPVTDFTITKPSNFSTMLPTTSPFPVTVVANYDGMTTAEKTINVTISAVKPVISATKEHYNIDINAPQPTQEQLISWFGITAVETGDGAITFSHEYENQQQFEFGKKRTYPIRIYATDDDGQMASRLVNLHVKDLKEDNKAPVITSESSKQTILEINDLADRITDSELIDLFGVNAETSTGTVIDPMNIIVNLSAVDFMMPNETTGYEVVFTITTADGSDSVSTTLLIRDLQPRVTANDAVYELVLGQDLPDNATLLDYFEVIGREVNPADTNQFLDVSGDVTVARPDMTGAMIGDEFEVKFNLTDELDHDAEPAIGVVRIVAPEQAPVNQPPVINVKVLDKKVYEQASSVPLTTEDMLKLFKITITDAENGNLTTEIIPRPGSTTTVVPTNYDHPGNYKLQLVVKETKLVDGQEVVINTVTQDLNLKIKEVYPWIELSEYEGFLQIGSEPMDILDYFGPIGTEFAEGDLTAGVMYDTYIWDEYGEDIIPAEIDYENGGEYLIRFYVTDEEGNLAENYGYLYIGDEFEEGINISSRKYQIVPEEIALKVQDFIDLYGINAVTTWFENVNQYVDIVGKYDISHPDVYPLTISVDYYGLHKDFDIVLEVEDTLPTISARTDKLSIDTDDNLGDLVNTFGVTATEITPSDLTTEIVVDDSAIETKGSDYVAGTYPVTFTATDEEGNTTTTTTEVEVTSEDTEDTIIDDNKAEVASESATVDDQDDDDSTPTTTNTTTTKTMSLANTGSSAVAVGLVLLFSLVAIFLIRLGLASQKNHHQE